MNEDERNALAEEYGQGYDLLMSALSEVPRQAWEFKPAPGEWSIHEIVIHMSDSEWIGALRARKLIAEPGSTLMTYREEIWADALNYQNQDVDGALQLFKLTRQTNYQLLKALPDEVFTHTVVHPEKVYPEYGEGYTLEKWLKIYARHVRDHVEQVKQTYQAWKERNT